MLFALPLYFIQDGLEKPPVKERPVNMNIRKPIIPGRTLPGESAPDSNPLRRLRDSQHFSRPTAVPPRPPSGGTDSSESPNTPRTNGVTSSRIVTETSRTKPDISNPKPLPPRVPLKPSTINLKPRERRHPLDISEPISVLQKDGVQKRREVDSFVSSTTRIKSQSQSSGSDLNTTRDSEDSVFTSSSESDTRPAPGRQQVLPSEISRKYPGVFTAESQFSVKMVDTSAEEMGLHDSDDQFWTEQVSVA